MLQDLPEDVQEQLLALLPQSSQSRLAQTCKTLNQLSLPLLARAFRCVTCRAHLFHPRELCFTPDDLSPTPAHGPTSRLPRRVFVRLITRRSLDSMGITLDARLGAANFHVLRHLSQTIYKERFPLPAQLQSVRALRCATCGVFVGFRHSHDEIRDFVHHDFVELVDGKDALVTLAGRRVPPPRNAVTCANADCRNILFTRDDVLPWTHVLASTRLTDLDAYLEWDHSWAGAATASQPAFFVKRLEEGCASVRHVRPEKLRQGEMVVGDVHCAGCDNQIGWKFVSEVPDGDEVRNYDQVGRFGIIRTAVAPTEPRSA